MDIFQAAIAHFESEQEEVRAAAAFAAGKHELEGSEREMLIVLQATSPSATCITSYRRSSSWWRLIPRSDF